MNLIPKIAEMLGVEIGEEFGIQEVEDCDTEMFRFKYRFTQTELQFKNGDYWVQTTVPTSLLMGKAEIKKLPFEPKKGEKYFVVSVVDKSACCSIWVGNTTDYCYKACGNCFRTEKEAEAHKYEIYEKLTGRKWEE